MTSEDGVGGTPAFAKSFTERIRPPRYDYLCRGRPTPGKLSNSFSLALFRSTVALLFARPQLSFSKFQIGLGRKPGPSSGAHKKPSTWYQAVTSAVGRRSVKFGAATDRGTAWLLLPMVRHIASSSAVVADSEA
jgi:hypothetical protein